jgi:two-component system nitrate/nitrite response regulator NarL
VTTTSMFVIDDHPVLREGIRMLVEASGQIRVVGSSATASGAIAALGELRPDVILLDLDLGGEDGLEWLPRILEAAPEARVLILTALRDRARDEEALRAGARGLVFKDAAPEVLLQAIRSVAGGALWFDPRLLAQPPVRAAPRPQGRTTADPLELTPRERELVTLVAEGLRNEEVGRRLGITEKTVRNHLTAVFQKLGVSGRLELVVYAYAHGLARAKR